MARPPLEHAIADPGFTPSVRDASGLIDLLADDQHTKDAERALGRLGAPAVDVLQARFANAKPPLRGRILRAIGRLSEDARARALLFAALADSDAKTRRNAVIALGHVGPEAAPSEPEGASTSDAEGALLDVWQVDPRPEMRRSIAAALGKIGGTRSLALLREEASRTGDPEMARIVGRSVMMIERTASRANRGHLDAARAPAQPVEVIALSRRGLEEWLAEELGGAAGVRDVSVVGPGRVRARLLGPMNAMFAARTMLSFLFPLPSERKGAGERSDAAIARAIAGEAAHAIFAAWTVGTVRYRIAWAEGGHKRSATWDAARAIAQSAPDLVNDPTESLWELLVESKGPFVNVGIAPRGLADPRFPWRLGDVPAASHPTLAAALARVAGVRSDDVVWDPFVGSGAELIERGLLGPYRSLAGTDVDVRALRVATRNLTAANMSADLKEADALIHRPEGVTLILTNPPMGRRASRTPGLADTLDRFVEHSASVLVPGGRLVWVAPWPKRARSAGTRAGLKLEEAGEVDMGGFDAELQRWGNP